MPPLPPAPPGGYSPPPPSPPAIPPPGAPPPAGPPIGACVELSGTFGDDAPCLQVWIIAVAGSGVLVLLVACAVLVVCCCCRKPKAPKGADGAEKGRSKKGKGGKGGKKGKGDAAERGDGLADGWEEHEDDDGNVYFYHELTRTTTWTRPTAKEKAKGKKGKKGDHKGSLVEVNFSSRDELQSTLPQEWEQHTDDSGLPYYYNTFTRVTSWTRPAANHC